MSGYEARRFGSMLLDEVRVETYLAALDRLIDPTTTVLDVGCGTGVFTLAALERGAAHVTAIDRRSVVDLLPTVVRANGYADRCTIYRGDVTELVGQRFDLIVSDLRGTVPLYRDHLQVMATVLNRNLTPGGLLLPTIDRLVVGLVSLPNWRDEQLRPWQLDRHDLSAYADAVMRTPTRIAEMPSGSLVTNAAPWVTIDYRSSTELSRRSFEATVSLEATKSTTADGVGVWFETVIHDDLGFDTAPSNRRPAYGRLFLPFPEPLDCHSGAAGGAVEVTVAAHRIGDDYAWRWRVAPAGRPPVEVSSFEAMALGPAATSPTTEANGGAGSAERLDRERAARDARILGILADGGDREAAEAELVRSTPGPSSSEDDIVVRRSARRQLNELLDHYREPGPVRLL